MSQPKKKYGKRIKRFFKYIKTIGLLNTLSALKGTILGKSTLVSLVRSDVKYPILLRLPSSDAPTYNQVFIQKDYDFQVESEPKVIIDAGANIGLASILFANKYPSAKIFAIEPENSNFEILKKNTEHYKNITAIQAALWHQEGEIALVDPGMDKWGFMTQDIDISAKQMGAACHTIRTITIDKLLATYALEKIDILKIDIEGAEKEVFSKTSSWINKVGAIIIELHDHLKPGCNRSFYNGSNGFDNEWKRGENVYISRGIYLTKS